MTNSSSFHPISSLPHSSPHQIQLFLIPSLYLPNSIRSHHRYELFLIPPNILHTLFLPTTDTNYSSTPLYLPYPISPHTRYELFLIQPNIFHTPLLPSPDTNYFSFSLISSIPHYSPHQIRTISHSP